MNETTPPIAPETPPTEKPPLDLRAILGEHLFVLIRDFPSNPALRGHILARTSQPGSIYGLWIPEEVKPEGFFDFIQENYKGPPPRKAPDRKAEVFLEGSFSESESGTCQYSCTNYRSGRVRISEQELIELAEEAGSNGDFRDKLIDYIHTNQEFDIQDSDNHDYGNYEFSGDTESNDDWEYTNLDQVVEDFYANHPGLDRDNQPEE